MAVYAIVLYRHGDRIDRPECVISEKILNVEFIIKRSNKILLYKTEPYCILFLEYLRLSSR